MFSMGASAVFASDVGAVSHFAATPGIVINQHGRSMIIHPGILVTRCLDGGYF